MESRVVNAAIREWHKCTNQWRFGLRVQRSHAFSKDWDTHLAATRLSHFSYNFC
jgi:hypothetical protein